jgi:hypothetical protein
MEMDALKVQVDAFILSSRTSEANFQNVLKIIRTMAPEEEKQPKAPLIVLVPIHFHELSSAWRTSPTPRSA